MNTLKDLIIDTINNLSIDDLIGVNNSYSREVMNGEDVLYLNDEEFFEIFFENKVMEAIKACHFGNFNFADTYIKFNGYGNLDTCSHFETKDLCDSVEMIAAYMLDNEEEFSHIINFDELRSDLEEAE